MIPIAPIIVAILFASGRSELRGRNIVVNDRSLATLIWIFFVPMMLAAIGALWSSELIALRLLALVTGFLLVVLAFPSAFVALSIRRGWVKPACHLTTLCFWRWAGDREGAGIFNGALAAVRGEQQDAIGYLDGRVVKAKHGHGAMLLAESVLSRLRNDHDRADALLRAIVFLPHEIVPIRVRAIGAEVVIGEALARGDFEAAIKIRGTGSREAVLLSACARALATWPPCPTTAFAAWRWRTMRQLLRLRISWHALFVRPGDPWRRLVDDAKRALADQPDVSAHGAESAAPIAVEGCSTLQAAVLHVAHAKRHAASLTDADITSLAIAINDAPRALADEPSADDDLKDAAAAALDDVVRALSAHWGPPQRAVLHAMTYGLDDDDGGALDALEALVEPLPREVPLPASAELFEWVKLRELYERALAGDAQAFAPYSLVRDPIWNHSANIFNKGQKGLGRAMFQFLLDESLKRNDIECIEGMRKNLQAQ